jgi:hypothetical protein
MNEIKVGDKVWYATFDQREEKVPCPVCYGNKKVIVILGNGDEVEVDCRYCEVGFEGSKGWVKEYTKLPLAECVTITGRRIEENNSKQEIEYHYNSMGSSYRIADPERMFETEEEAINCAVAMAEEENQAKANKPKYKDEKTYAWNAGYHLKRAKDRAKEAEYHAEKAKICKSRSKEK